MTLTQALLVYGAHLMGDQPYDYQVMNDTIEAIVDTTSNVQESSTLLKIARYESGGFRRDVANCAPKSKGDGGSALGLWQVHAQSDIEKQDLCSSDYRKQAVVALRRVRWSANSCRRHGLSGAALLNEYTSGSCSRGNAASKLRWSDGKELQALVYTEVTQPIFKRHPNFCSSEQNVCIASMEEE